MKLALVTRELVGVTTWTGGVGVRYLALARALAAAGHEVRVVVPLDEGRAGVDGSVAGLVVERVARPAVGGFWFVPAMRAVRAAGPFDAVLVPEWVGDGWAYARRQDAGPLVTNLVTSLDQILALSPGWRRPVGMRVKHVPQRRLERAQAEGSAALVACSRAVLEWAQRLWDLEGIPAQVVPNGMDVPATRRLGEGELVEGLPGGPRVVFFGRLEIRKGAVTLVQAMRRVWEAQPDAQLVLCGRDTHSDEGGWVSEQLRRLAGERAGQLHVLGPLAPERLFPVVRSADVVALPSRWEAFGIAALEAMALGRASVLTSGSGFAEFCRDGVDGLLVEPDDDEQLAEAIVRLLGDGALRERLGASASARADEFDAPRMAERFAAAFASLA